jgi:hypothetical protein
MSSHINSFTGLAVALADLPAAGSHRPVGALAAVPGVMEFSRPRPPRPEIPGLRLPQP